MSQKNQPKSVTRDLVIKAIIDEYWFRKKQDNLGQVAFAKELGISLGSLNNLLNNKFCSNNTLAILESHLEKTHSQILASDPRVTDG